MSTPAGVFKFSDANKERGSFAGYFESYANMLIKCAKARSGISDNAEKIRCFTSNESMPQDVPFDETYRNKKVSRLKECSDEKTESDESDSQKQVSKQLY